MFRWNVFQSICVHLIHLIHSRLGSKRFESVVKLLTLSSGIHHFCWQAKEDKTLWAASQQNLQNDMCAQRRLRSTWVCTQSDQSLRYALNGWLRTQGFFMRTAKTLIRLGRHPGRSESSLGARSFFFWLCRDVALIKTETILRLYFWI